MQSFVHTVGLLMLLVALVGGTYQTATAQQATLDVKPVQVDAGKVALTSENTMIQFTGTHTGDDPNPRVGVFEKISGVAEVADGTLTAIAVEIDTASLHTPIEKLTNHLKSPDFFDSREYPTAKFVSTKIAAGANGQQTVTGNLTIMAETKEVSFPATIDVSEQGVTLTGGLTLDRTEFGMSNLTERVNKEIMLAVAIGKASQLAAIEAN